MQTPADITWRNMDASDAVAARVDERIQRLEKFSNRITRCHVVVEAPHHRHRKGNEYEVRLDVTIPGHELSVGKKPGNVHAHFDVMVAVRDAFDAMERQLKRWKEEHSGRPEATIAPLQGRIADIDPNAGSGNIATTDGRLVYFHRNSLVSGDFDKLSEGDVVELVVDPGDDAAGAHASTVRVITAQRFLDQPG